jgi:hypothetical protein
MAMRAALLLAAAASASALHLGGAPTAGMPSTKLQARSQTAQILRAAAPANAAQLEHIKGGAPAEAAASPLKLMLLIVGWCAAPSPNLAYCAASGNTHTFWGPLGTTRETGGGKEVDYVQCSERIRAHCGIVRAHTPRNGLAVATQ